MIEPSYFWTCTLLLAIGTYAIRSLIIMMSARIRFSERAKLAFSFIPASILPAIAWPMVFAHAGHVSWLFHKERLLVLILSAALAHLTRQLTLTLVFGLVTLYIVSNL